MASDDFYPRLVEAAAMPYRSSGRWAFGFARGKLGADPVFPALLKRGLIPGGTLVDLGCGQGMLLALLHAAEQPFAVGNWPDDWAKPPRMDALFGVDFHPSSVRRASAALGDRAQITVGDLREIAIRDADVIVILDVLHYLEPAAQDDLLDRIRRALPPRGRLLARVCDGAAGTHFALTCAADWLACAMRGQLYPRFHTRTLAAWIGALGRHGFAVEHTPMSAGTPFANVLLHASVIPR